MVPKAMVITILALIIFSWMLVGEKKTFGEKVGTILIFVVLYLLYIALNAEQTESFINKLKEILRIY